MTTQNILQNPLIDSLQTAGLTPSEAAMYLALLELGTSSVWEISKKAGIKRPTCYVILDGLLKKGFGSTTYDGRRTLYTAATPKLVVKVSRQRQEKLEDSLQELEALASPSPAKPFVQFFEGKEGIRQVYERSLEIGKGGEILTYGSDQLLKANYGSFLDSYIEQRIKLGITIRLLYADTAENRSQYFASDPKKWRESRYLPSDRYDPSIEKHIYGDTIAYIAHSATCPFATIMENATLAREERQVFEMLWSSAG